MPGLGHTVREQAVREDFDAMDLVDFCAEYLGWAPMESRPRWTLIKHDTWDNLRDPSSLIVGRPALAVEMAEDRSSGWIGAAGRRADGDWHVEIVEPGFKVPAGIGGVEWILPRLLEMVAAQKPVTVAIDTRRPAASLIVPLRNKGVDVLTPNGNDVAGACGRFFDATGELVSPDGDPGPRVHHLGQPELDQALAGARKLDLGAGAFTFVKKGSSSTISPLYAVVLAMHGHDVKDSPQIPRSKVW
jgi:hypothetical protein